MTAAYAMVGDARAVGVTLHVASTGPWFADVELEGAPDISGRVELRLGDTTLSGTVLPLESGVHMERRRMRIVAGAGAWGSLLAAKAYHNDAGIRALLVAQDAARESGETLGDDFAPALDRLGIDYVRRAGRAARALEDAAGGATWWVDYAGITRVGTRPSSAARTRAYIVTEYDPRARIVDLALDDDDVSLVGIGTILSEGLEAPQTVRELEIDVGPDRMRVRAWCGGQASARGMLLDAIRAIVAAETDRYIYGPRKYRVIRMAGTPEATTGWRVHLQAVRRSSGLPDIEPISMWPGMAGLHARLTPGAEVLVEFIDGEPTQPIITHFVGNDGESWSPVELVLDASQIKAGKDASDFAAKAQAVLDRLQAIVTGFNAHTHTGGTLGGGVTGAPQTSLSAPASVAASKVQVQ